MGLEEQETALLCVGTTKNMRSVEKGAGKFQILSKNMNFIMEFLYNFSKFVHDISLSKNYLPRTVVAPTSSDICL